MGLIPSPTILSIDEMGRVAPPIFTSVGRGGLNAPGDVFVVQSLLNDRLPKPHAPIPVTGIADVGTTLAIENYQAAIMKMNAADRPGRSGEPDLLLAGRPPVGDAQALATVGHYGELPPPVIAAAERRSSAGACRPGHPGAMGGRERMGRRHATRKQQPVWHQGGREPARRGK